MTGAGILIRMRTAGLLLALFALTFKAMLPPGFMLEAHGSRIAVTLCSGEQAFIDPQTGALSHTGGGDAPAKDGAAQHCPFAVTSTPMVAEPAFLASPPALEFLVAAPAPNRSVHDAGSAAGPPRPARGPPLFA